MNILVFIPIPEGMWHFIISKLFKSFADNFSDVRFCSLYFSVWFEPRLSTGFWKNLFWPWLVQTHAFSSLASYYVGLQWFIFKYLPALHLCNKPLLGLRENTFLHFWILLTHILRIFMSTLMRLPACKVLFSFLDTVFCLFEVSAYYWMHKMNWEQFLPFSGRNCIKLVILNPW